MMLPREQSRRRVTDWKLRETYDQKGQDVLLDIIRGGGTLERIQL